MSIAKLTLRLSAMLVLGVAPAFAQSDVFSVMMPVVMNPCPTGTCQLGSGGARGPTSPTSAPHGTSYAVSAQTVSIVQKGFVDRLAKRNPRSATDIDAQLRSHDFGRIYTGIVAPFGLHRGDAADALTAYTLLGWMIATSQTDPTVSQVAAARREVAANVATNPALASETARAKLGEEVAILFVLLHAGWQSSQREGKATQYSDGVAAMFKKQFGQDLRQMALTDQGFVKRG